MDWPPRCHKDTVDFESDPLSLDTNHFNKLCRTPVAKIHYKSGLSIAPSRKIPAWSGRSARPRSQRIRRLVVNCDGAIQLDRIWQEGDGRNEALPSALGVEEGDLWSLSDTGRGKAVKKFHSQAKICLPRLGPCARRFLSFSNLTPANGVKAY
jgi:hypothetical protein